MSLESLKAKASVAYVTAPDEAKETIDKVTDTLLECLADAHPFEYASEEDKKASIAKFREPVRDLIANVLLALTHDAIKSLTKE